MESNNDILVEVKGLSKKFCKDLKKSLWYGVKDLFSGISGNKHTRTLRPDEFWAVKDISFTLKRGECLGLIGHNGAGKSTLLKILNGLINPDEGTVKMTGRVGALIELGAGFNPILSGRENIYNNGAVLGFSKKEIDDKLEEIIDFSEIREFIDMPVQNYSSGMKVRLGFAIASQMEPDILIIDEVLAVGDLGFVLKCFKQIDVILPNTALIFVSHSMPMISRISSKIILLEKGQSIYSGENVSKGIDNYYDRFNNDEGSDVVFDTKNITFLKSEIINTKKEVGFYTINWGATLEMNFVLKNINLTQAPYFSFAIYDKEQRAVAEIHSENQIMNKIESDEIIEFTIRWKNIQLSKGIYYITINASESLGKNFYLKIHKVLSLKVEHNKQIWTPFLMDTEFVESKQ